MKTDEDFKKIVKERHLIMSILMVLTVIYILFMLGCQSDPGQLIVSDEPFVLQGCEDAKKNNRGEQC